MGILGAGINFSIGKPGVAEWGVQKLDTTYWAADPNETPVWNGSAWESYTGGKGYEFVRLIIPTSKTWHVGYRPEKIQLTWTGGGSNMRIVIEDVNGYDVVYVTSQSSNGVAQEYTLDWQSDDFRSSDTVETFNMDSNGGAFTLTDIRFSS